MIWRATIPRLSLTANLPSPHEPRSMTSLALWAITWAGLRQIPRGSKKSRNAWHCSTG